MNNSFLGWGESAETWERLQKGPQVNLQPFLKERRSEASVRSR